MLPHVLRIRGDTTITAGTLQLAARNQPIDDGQALTGSLLRGRPRGDQAGGRCVGRSGDRDVRQFAATNGTVRVESLKCESEFLRVDACRHAQQLTADASSISTDSARSSASSSI